VPADEPDRGPDDAPGVPGGLDDLGAFIRDRREAARLSLRRLSHLAGVSNPYLSQIERGLRKPSAEILQAIAKGLEISSETLYVRAGILDDRPGGPDVEQAILRDTGLTRAQREALIELHRSFRRANAAVTADDAEGRGADGAAADGRDDDGLGGSA
jgi:transcriptional regulator with XRE-family HTH domain